MGQLSLAFVASDHHITYWPKASSHRYQIEPVLPACAAERSNSTKFAMTRIDFVDWTFRRVPATLWLRFSELNAEDAEKSHKVH